MKRTLLFLALPFLLVGCAQLFDSNLFKAVDTPPPLDLKGASVSELKNQMSDPSFVQRLKDDPAQLKVAQDSLISVMDDPASAPADILEAGATLVELSCNASGVADMKADLINNVGSIADYIGNGEYAKALKLFMGGQTEAEMKATLDNLVVMANALNAMQIAAAKTDGTIDSDLFFASASDPASFALSALMAGISHALIEDSGGSTAALAADLAKDEPTTSSSGVHMTKLIAAKDATDPSAYTIVQGRPSGSTYSYSYVAILQDQLAISL